MEIFMTFVFNNLCWQPLYAGKKLCANFNNDIKIEK